MKKFSLWLIKVTGVEDDLRNKYYREVGDRILSAHYWFNGGVDGPAKPDVLNTLFLIGKQLKECAWFDVGTVRRKVYKMDGVPYHKIEADEIAGM